MSIVTTEEPVLSTALVMKDLFEYRSISLDFVLINDWDTVFGVDIVLIKIAKKINIC